MAKKLKFSANKKSTCDLFQLTGNLFADSPDSGRSDFAGTGDFEVTPAPPVQTHNTVARIQELRMAEIRASRSLKFISFGSGSSGNSAYIGDEDGGIIIDAGVDVDTVRAAMKFNGLSMGHVKAVCLTHDHSDHVRFIYPLVRKHTDIGVYCTPKVLTGMLRRHSISRRIKDYHRPIYKEFPFKVGNFEITAFDVSHDGTDNSGFFITNGDHRFALATDLGCITPRVDYYMRQAQFIMLESNYDLQMLRTGPYPIHLKARIESSVGHLDNVEAARFLASVYSPGLSHVFLCHLSNENNTPEIALRASSEELLRAGAAGVGDGTGSIASRECAVQVVALPRFEASPLFSLKINR